PSGSHERARPCDPGYATRMARRFGWLAAASLAIACGTTPPPATPERPRIVSVREGRDVAYDELARALLAARAIYVGEQHDREADHRAQLAVLEAIRAREPSVAL